MIKVGVSNHHVHLTREACDVLFGKGYELTVKRPLLQKGQYAANETVDIIKNDKVLEHIRVVGPLRNYTQVELLDSDCEYLKINAPVRKSGDLDGSETVLLKGPIGTYEGVNSTIVSNTHIHMSSEDLITYNKVNDELVTVECNGNIIENVQIKSDDTCVLEMHINKDLAEKLNIETGDEVKIC